MQYTVGMKQDVATLKLVSGLSDRRITSDYIADALREAINNGSLADGAVLNQVAIAEHFGVSRVPVREAMRHLQAEDLIHATPHKRAVVRALSLERISEIHEVRALLEGYLISRAIQAFDDARMAKLVALDEEMSRVSDHSRWLKMNARFHRVLLEPSGATMALELVDQLRARGERYVKMWSQGFGINRAEEAGEEHRRILRAIEIGDGELAREEVQAHVLHTRDRLVRERPSMS
jgi:DNA-binding GntR family transcriptional regulator